MLAELNYQEIDVTQTPSQILDEYALNYQLTPIVIYGDYTKHRTYKAWPQEIRKLVFPRTDIINNSGPAPRKRGCGGCSN